MEAVVASLVHGDLILPAVYGELSSGYPVGVSSQNSAKEGMIRRVFARGVVSDGNVGQNTVPVGDAYLL